MIEIGALLAAAVLLAAVLVLDARQRRREARRVADAVFLADAARWAQTGRRRRPKVDRRIQRRRYGLR